MYSIPKMLFDEVTILFISSSFKYSIKLFSRAFANVSPLAKCSFMRDFNSESSLTKILEIAVYLSTFPHSEPKNKLLTTPR